MHFEMHEFFTQENDCGKHDQLGVISTIPRCMAG